MDLHRTADALIGRYGPGSRGLTGNPLSGGIEFVEAIDPVEVEYAAIRRGAAILDRPERSVVQAASASGAGLGDAIEFLNRMLTQELKTLRPFHATRSLWLNRKGRIDADLLVIHHGDRLLLELDAYAVTRMLEGEPATSESDSSNQAAAVGAIAASPPKASARGGLRGFVFAEDVEFKNLAQHTHRLTLVGPAACAAVAAVSTPSRGPRIDELLELQACEVLVRTRGGDPVPVVAVRWDSVAGRAGEIGLELIVPAERATEVYQALAPRAARVAAAGDEDSTRPRVVRAGWHAYNIARLEAGTPIYNLDFGPNSLPHELGREELLARVSFKKGCYLGQEVVARMESLGHPKQRLMGVRVIEAPNTASPQASSPHAAGSSVPDARAGGSSHATSPFLAELAEVQTGCPILEADAPTASVIGAVTSASMSPMFASATIALAMVKWSHAKDGQEVWVQSGGRRFRAVLRETLGCWTPKNSTAAATL